MDVDGLISPLPHAAPHRTPWRGPPAMAQREVLHAPRLCSRTTPAEAAALVWDAAALQRLFHTTLHGEQVIVVSNRAPCTHQRIDGQVHIVQPSSGLVTAVEPVVHACNGTWIAHGSGNADREAVGTGDVWRVPGVAGGGGYALRRVWLNEAERSGYCDGMSNGALWPLCHLAHVKPTFVEADWQHDRAVNRRFAQAVVDEARQSDPIVLVQDYHLALVPALVREQLPRATILSLWHVPWGHPQQMQTCPWLDELVEGLLGSDIVGLQTPQHRSNFVATAALCGHALDGPRSASPRDATRHAAQARSYPISIAWPTRAEALTQPSASRCRQQAFGRWSLPADGKLLVGVDRFDYTKGLVERLLGIEQLLLDRPQWLGRLRFVQVAAPTREALKDYAALRDEVAAQVRRINRRFAGVAPAPIMLLDTQHDKQAVNALYRAADVCLVTSLHDGMNLVAKEFVAARDDEHGVLVLSRFAGAAQELHDALLVNPYHTAQLARALHRALDMPAAEQRQRMRALRATVQFANVHRWAANMLLDAAALREARSPARQARAVLSLAAGV